MTSSAGGEGCEGIHGVRGKRRLMKPGKEKRTRKGTDAKPKVKRGYTRASSFVENMLYDLGRCWHVTFFEPPKPARRETQTEEKVGLSRSVVVECLSISFRRRSQSPVYGVLTD